MNIDVKITLTATVNEIIHVEMLEIFLVVQGWRGILLIGILTLKAAILSWSLSCCSLSMWSKQFSVTLGSMMNRLSNINLYVSSALRIRPRWPTSTEVKIWIRQLLDLCTNYKYTGCHRQKWASQFDHIKVPLNMYIKFPSFAWIS